MRKLMVALILSIVVLSLGALPPREETLIVEMAWGRMLEPGNFNIWTPAWRTSQAGMHQLMVEPFWMNEHAIGEIINALAKEPPIYNKDFTKLTIKLREGVYWSDGVEFTADDVVYGIETTIKNPGMSYHDIFKANVKKVYKTDKYTVVIELKKPNSRFHTYFVDRWGAWRPFPKHIFEKAEDPAKFDFNPPVSLGPYVVKEYDPAGYWILWERRKDWDRTPTGMLYGKPKPKYVLFRYYESPEQRVMAMLKHELDVSYLSPETAKILRQKAKTARLYQNTFPWVVDIDPCTTGITLNAAKFPFNIKDVRWALVLAIDIVDAISIAYDGCAMLAAMHLPPTPSYQKWYYKPLEEWLKNFELDLGNGEKFKPFDPTIPFKIAEYARKRGYDVPDDPELIRRKLCIGWWKYAPDAAEKLLKKHGFKRDKNGKWLLPDGTPWKIVILAATDVMNSQYKNPLAVAQQWKKFGIDVEIKQVPDLGTPTRYGKFDAAGAPWPVIEPWGGHPDLYRSFDPWYSGNVRPIGEPTPGHPSRWHSDEMDKVIEKLRETNWNDIPKIIELGKEGLKIAVKEMPSIPLFNNPLYLAFDNYWWTNWPTFENLYMNPMHCFPNLKYLLPFLEPAKR